MSIKQIILIALINICYVTSFNKYSEEANMQSKVMNYKSLDKPFRMQKMNLLWEKAQKSIPEQKLKSLYTDLKLQDKDEFNLKTLKAAGKDKEGLKEAVLRRTLNAIIAKYGLTEHFIKEPESNEAVRDEIFSAPSDDYLNKRLFKDKKLNKLWLKAESFGFTDEELKVLKEEFNHHQEKVDQYHNLLNEINEKSSSDLKDEKENSIEILLAGEEAEMPKYKQIPNTQQLLKEKHRELKSGYDHLTNQVVGGIKKKDFDETHIQKLWELAQKADFNAAELDSLKEELQHYEHRVQKLKYLEADLEFSLERHVSSNQENMSDGLKQKEKRVKDFNYKVNKIHTELQNRIMQRHLEL